MFHVKRDGTLEFSISCHLNHRDNRITRDDVVKSVRDGLSYRATFKDNSKKARQPLGERCPPAWLLLLPGGGWTNQHNRQHLKSPFWISRLEGLGIFFQIWYHSKTNPECRQGWPWDTYHCPFKGYYGLCAERHPQLPCASTFVDAPEFPVRMTMDEVFHLTRSIQQSPGIEKCIHLMKINSLAPCKAWSQIHLNNFSRSRLKSRQIP